MSVRDVAQAYAKSKLARELETDPGTVLIYRPVSFVIASLLARLGVTPNAVTMTAGLVNPAIVVVVLTATPSTAFAAITFLGILYALLDCVDGDIARVSNLTSSIGHYCDFVFDVVHRFVFYGALGYLADRLVEPSPLLVRLGMDYFGLMLVTAWIVLFTRLCREWSPPEEDRSNSDTTTAAARSGRSFRPFAWAVFSSIDQHYAILGFLSWTLGLLEFYLVYLFVVTVVDVLISQSRIIGQISGGES